MVDTSEEASVPKSHGQVMQGPARLLPSPFEHRSPTFWFESPPTAGKATRSELHPAVAAKLLALNGVNPGVRLELNANCIRHAFKRNGFSVNEVFPGGEFLVNWARHTGSELWSILPHHAITNHFPGSWTLGRKDGLWRILSEQARRLSASEYAFVPKTFCLPQDRVLLEHSVERGGMNGTGAFIVKPLNSSRGRGVRVTYDPLELPPEAKVLVQEYIDRPFLLHGRKFDLRVYVLVTSYDPLRAYTYENGLVRFATEDYIAPNAMDPDCEMRKSAHITNYSVQKKSSKYIANANAEEDSTGHKWSLEALMRELAAMGHDVDSLRKRIDEILVKTLIAAQPHICTKYNARFRRRNACFEVFGFDIMLDEALTPWIIEVNVSPDLSSSSPLDRVLKGNLAADVFQLLGIRANRVGEALGPEEPPLLTRANCGHSPNELSTVPLCELGKLELECLVEAEEEWWRASLTNFRTLIPTAASVRKFGPRFSTGGRASTFSSPRYADFLLAGYVTRARRCNELHSAVQSGKSEVMRPSSASVQPECANPISAASTVSSAQPFVIRPWAELCWCCLTPGAYHVKPRHLITGPRFTSKVVEAAAFYYESLFAFGQVIRSRASGRESNAANFKPSSLFRRTVTPSRLRNDFLLTTASGSTASRASAITYRSHRRSTGFSSTGDDWNEAAHAFQLQRSNFCQHQTFIITQFKWAAGAGRLASGSTQGCHCQTSGQTAQRERVPK